MSEPLEPLIMRETLQDPETGEPFEVTVTIEGHIHPMAAAAAVFAVATRMDNAINTAKMAASMVDAGIPREVVEQMLGLADAECTCGNCDVQPSEQAVEAELASIGSPTDEDWDTFMRDLNGS